jgi:hypothetical protein
MHRQSGKKSLAVTSSAGLQRRSQDLPAVTKYEVALGISTDLWVWRRVGFLGRNGVLAPYPLREGGVRALGSQALRRIRLLTRLWHDVHLLQPVCAPAGFRRKASTAAAASRAVMTSTPHRADLTNRDQRAQGWESRLSRLATDQRITRTRRGSMPRPVAGAARGRGGRAARRRRNRSAVGRRPRHRCAAASGRDPVLDGA